MKIEIWSDVICPWCGLGQHRLDTAIAELGRADIEVRHRSFLLEPDAPSEVRPVRDMLRAKGMNEAQMAGVWLRIEAMAAKEGLTPYILDNVVANTRPAHELLALASARGHEHAAWKRVYRAYFGERRSIFELDALVALGEEIGLAPAETRDALIAGTFRAQVEHDMRDAHAIGVTGVPFVLIDRKIAISGAQPLDTFRQALARASSVV